MQDLLEGIKNIIANDLIDTWIYEVFAVVLVVLILAFIARRVLTKLAGKTAATYNPWDDALVNAVRRPLRYTIIILGISYAAQIAGAQTDAEIFKYINPIRYTLITAMISWALISFVARLENATIKQKLQTGQQVDKTSIHAIGKLIRVAIFITTALVILQTLGFSVSGVLAFGGIGGIAIGFAAKDLLSNFFGGLMIYLDRPFTVGDWIRSPDRQIEGTVESIGWRLTVIRTFDKRPLYVPNSIFATIAVENPSRMSHRRIYETIGLRYDDVTQMNRIVEDVKAMLKAHEEIDQMQTMIVNFNAFNESSVDFFIYTFTKTTNWVHFHEVKQDVLLKISDIVVENGAEMAFPTTTMFLQQGQLDNNKG
ncbi:MAG: mechanosensitive ion channel family protein [Gammaproteobacteria bacterium]|nr:mechanosensitive ion channel family protein [Gammaproteobacteria bacterium]